MKALELKYDETHNINGRSIELWDGDGITTIVEIDGMELLTLKGTDILEEKIPARHKDIKKVTIETEEPTNQEETESQRWNRIRNNWQPGMRSC